MSQLNRSNSFSSIQFNQSLQNSDLEDDIDIPHRTNSSIIGNNLNQIAKQLNAQAASTSRPGEGAYSEFEATHLEIRQCLAQLDSHVKTCANALALSRERWRIELKD